MRIHTNATHEQIDQILSNLPGVNAEVFTEHRSATHARAFELVLSGRGARGLAFNRTYFQAATWDEWGAVMACIFGVDRTTRMGGTAARPIYADADDFHWQTGDRFRGKAIPRDTHARHTWDHTGGGSNYSVQICRRCTARRRWMI